MNKLPKVLIVGRPNVGKSTLINKILGRKELITYDMPGVTRDCLEYSTDWNGKPFLLVDSGGILLEQSDDIYLQDKIESLIGTYADQAHKIIFVTDFKVGLHVIDKTIAKFLWQYKDKVKVAVNKVDNPDMLSAVSDFYSLGLDEPIGISSLHGIGVGDLLDWATENMSKDIGYAEPESFKVAFVGRPNVGKSSLLNAIIEDDRVIVDDKAGTTRDSVEVSFNHNKNNYKIIDTAGIRKKAKNAQGVEFYSVVRTKKSIGRADIVVVMMDANLMMAEQDKRIIQMVLDAKKNMLLFVNKVDLFEDEIEEFNKAAEEEAKELEALGGESNFTPHVFDPHLFIERMEEMMPALKDYPKIFGSVKSNVNIKKMFTMIPQIVENSHIRISTSELNQFIEYVIKRNPPPTKRGTKVKVKYGTQVAVCPPTFVFFMNKGDEVPVNYERFIEKQFRTFYNHFEGIPIQIIFRSSAKQNPYVQGDA